MACNKQSIRLMALTLCAALFSAGDCLAVPLGYTSNTILTDTPPVGLAFAAPGSPTAGTLYAYLETPNRTATILSFNPDLTPGTTYTATSLDANNFYLGGMAYDPVDHALLLTDNAGGAQALYSIDIATGAQQTIATGIATIAGVAVRSTGEIFISTAPFADNSGQVLQVDRTTGATTPVHSGLDLGAGLAFNAAGDLIIEDADFNTFAGRLTLLPITSGGPGLSFGTPTTLISGVQAGAGLAIDSEGNYFMTGSGGLFEVSGSPLAATNFDNNGNPFQFAVGIAFYPGGAPFEPFAGGGSRLAFMADYGFAAEDIFLSLITPSLAPTFALPEPGAGMLPLSGILLGAVKRRRRGK